MLCFESKRLVAKKFTEDDLEWLLTLHSNPVVMKTLGGVRTALETQNNLVDYLAHWDKYGCGFWMVSLKRSGEKIGRIGLRHSILDGLQEVELAYSISDAHWGQGLATEICSELLQKVQRELPVKNLVCFTSSDNLASRRVMEKLKFQFEKDFVYKDCSSVLYRRILTE